MMRYKKGISVRLVPFFMAVQLMHCLPGFAEVPVVELDDRQAATPVKASASQTSATTSLAALPAGSRQNQLSEIFTQMQQLQQEVQELRGLVEQQSFELQNLKLQSKDNYIDLDRRMSELQSAPVNSGASVGALGGGESAPVASSGVEKDSYDAAYKLLDQNKKDEAVLAFRKHIALYPSGEFAANAYYWLGQIYLTQGQLDLAQEQFTTLLKNYPEHRKVPDAKFALAKVYFQQGKKAEAKKIIQDVAQGDSKTAALAKTFLQDNF